MARAYNLDVPDYILKKLDPEKLRAHDERYAVSDSSDNELSISHDLAIDSERPPLLAGLRGSFVPLITN